MVIRRYQPGSVQEAAQRWFAELEVKAKFEAKLKAKKAAEERQKSEEK